MKKDFVRIAAATAVFSLALTGCVSKVSGGAAAAGDSIKIGVFEPITGANAAGGAMEVEGAQLANQLYPDVAGKKITLDVVDNKSDKVEAGNAAKRLVEQDKVNAVIGSWGSGLSMAAGPTFQQSKVPAVAASATNPLVTQGNPYYFRVCFIDPFQGKVLAQLAATQLKAKSVAIVTEKSNDYSVGLAKYFVDTFKSQGGQVVAEVSYQTGDQDFNAQLTEIKSKNPDVIFAPGNFTESALVVKQARQLGMQQKFLGGDTWETPDFVNVGGSAVEGVYLTTFFQTEKPVNELSKKFIAEYTKKFNKEPSAVAALGFDAYLVIRDAIEKTGGTDGTKLQAYIAGLKNFEGATGSITMDSDRNAVKDVVIKTVKGGKFVYETTVAHS